MSLISKLIQSPKVAATISTLVAENKKSQEEEIIKTTRVVNQLLDKLDAALVEFTETGEIPEGWDFVECEAHGPEFYGELSSNTGMSLIDAIKENPHEHPDDLMARIQPGRTVEIKIEINQVRSHIGINLDEHFEEIIQNIPGVSYNTDKKAWMRSGYEIGRLDERPDFLSRLMG